MSSIEPDPKLTSTLIESSQLLKSFDPKSVFILNNYVDVMDSYSSWRISKIIEIKDDMATINFDGWSSKWNETIKLGGNKISPFKKYTPPYTGGQKQAARDFDFDRPDCKNLIFKAINQMETIATSKFLTGEPYFLTQYVRGEIYILVDAVLSINQNIKHPTDLKLIIEFLESFIQFFVKYLEVLPSLMKEYTEGRAINHMLYLTNDKIAVVSCLPEMVDTMTKLFGGIPRCLKLFQSTEFALKSPTTVYATKPRDKFSSHHNQIVNNINYFGSLGGFEKLFALLRWEMRLPIDPKNKDSNEKDNILRFPIHLLKFILPMINPICSLMSTNFQENFFKDFKTIFFDRIEKMTQREIKESDSYQALILIRESFTTFEDYYGKDTYQFIEQAEFEFTLKLLKSPFLEKKIKALNEFKDFFDRADPEIDSRQLGDKRKFRYLTRDKLKNLILQRKVIEYLLEDIFHAEILKRSTVIMKFLAIQNSLTNEHLNILWKACENKHEALVRVVYEAIIEISNFLSVDSLDYLFSKFFYIPMEKYDDVVINLIKEFSSNAMQIVSNNAQNSYFAAKKKQPKYEFYGLRLLWDAIQDNSKLECQWVSQAFSAIASLIKNPNFRTEKEKYLYNCFDNLKKGNSVPQSLLLSLHILSTYAGQMNFLGVSLEDILNKYNKEFNFLESLVTDFERYIAQVTAYMKIAKTKNQIPENKATHIFVGKYAHQQSIDHRLLFLENIMNHLKKTDKEFTFEHIKRLWNCLVKKAVTEVEQASLLSWLTKSKDSSNSSKTKIYLFGDNILKSLFINVLCDPVEMENFIGLTPEVFKCWEKLFEIVNEKENALENMKTSIRVLKYNQLMGPEVLWQILINNKNEKVLRSAKNLLVNIHLRIQMNTFEDKIKIWQSFFDKCVEYLKSNSDPNTMLNVISLMNLFIVNIEGKKFLGKDGPSQEYISFIIITKNEDQKKTILLPSNATFFFLRKKIAEEFNFGLNDFEIMLLSGAKISPEMEEEYSMSHIEHLKDKDREKDIIVIPRSSTYSSSINLKEKFKTVVASNQGTMDILLQLLSTSNAKIANDVWDLLNFLPTNRRLKNELEKLNFDSEEAWGKFFDFTCVKKLQYCLQIILEFINPNLSVAKEINDWCMKFIYKKGLSSCINIFFKYKIEELKSTFYSKCFNTLMKILDYFFQNYPANFFENFEDEKKLTSEMAKKLLTGLTIMTKQTCTDQQEEGETKSATLQTYRELAQYSFGFLNSSLKKYPHLIEQIFNYPNLLSIIQNGLIESKDISIRMDIATNIINLVETMNSLATDQKIEKPHLFFLSLFLDNFLKTITSNRDKCSHFFYVIEHIYQNSTTEELETSKIDFIALFESLIQEIINAKPFESTQTEKDHLLQGLLRFVNTLIKKNPKLKDHPSLKKTNFVKEILQSCLFEIPQEIYPRDVILPPKCKSLESRRAAFRLLGTLCSKFNESILKAVEYLKVPLQSNFWRTSNYGDWFIHSSMAERGKSGYVGLKNLGCTCYMNSLIQQFFMIPDFRDSLLATEDYANKNDIEDNVLYQLQLIFAALKLSQRQYFDPRGFCSAFKDYEGKSINVLEQMDVDEFFNNLLDKLENLLKSHKNEGIIKRVFGGVLSNQLICKGCPHYSEREEPFLAISLQVKNKKNINESLASFVQGEMLEGDNAYLCERCDKKVPTLKRVCIKKLPNILMLVLKRFEFDFDTMQKYKVNDYCEFPHKLSMQQYTQMYLKKKEMTKKSDETPDTNEEDENELEYPPEYYEYNLTGIVIHMGTAESGHYYSLIKDKNGNWMEFNDNIVKLFDLKDLPQEAFGGEEKVNVGNIGSGGASNNPKIRERTRNAYLLFYQRTNYFDLEGQQINSLSIAKSTDYKEYISPRILNEIKEDNFKFHMTKMIFDKEYSEYVTNVLLELNKCEQLDTIGKLETAKFGILFLITVPLRAKERSILPSFLRETKTLLRKSYELSAWFINAFKNPKIIKEFLISCPVKDMKYFIVGLLRAASEKVTEQDQKLDYQAFLKENKLMKLIDSLVYCIYEYKDQLKMIDKVFDTLMTITLLGDPNIILYMLNNKMIVRILCYINNRKLSPNYKDYKEFIDSSMEEIKDLGEPTETLNKKTDLIKSMGDILEKKKEKMNLDSMVVNYNGLIVTLSQLILSLDINQQQQPPSSSLSSSSFYNNIANSLSPADTNNTTTNNTTVATILIPYSLDEDEKTLLFSHPNLIEFIMVEATSKKGKLYLSNMLAHLSTKNMEYSTMIFNIIEKGLEERDDTQLNIFLQTLEKLMAIKDEYQNNRVDRGVKIITQAMKQNSIYFVYTEICIDYLIKICSRNLLVLKVISEDKQFIKTMELWIRENANPAASIANNRLKIYKKREAKLILQLLQEKSKKLELKRDERISKLKKIHKNDPEGIEPIYDLEEDYSDHKFEIGEKLDYFTEQNGWIAAIVLENLEDMLNIRFLKDQNTTWIYFDSDKIGPHMKVQDQTKYDVEFYYKI